MWIKNIFGWGVLGFWGSVLEIRICRLCGEEWLGYYFDLLLENINIVNKSYVNVL